MAKNFKRNGRVMQLMPGIEQVGNKVTINHKESQIDVYEWGVLLMSKKTKEEMIIYSQQIKSVKLFPEDEVENNEKPALTQLTKK